MFKRVLLCALTGLLAAMAGTVPSDAAGTSVRLHAAKVLDEDTARLEGRVTGQGAVVIQRYAAGRRHWVRVKRVRANAEGLFRTRVRATDRAVRYRAVAGGVASGIRTVPAVETPGPVTPPPSDACGPRPLKADGTRWSCTLADDFNGTELNRAIWNPQTHFGGGSPTGNPCFIDDPSVIAVRDGHLNLSVREVPEVLTCLPRTEPRTAHVAGMVSTYHRFSQQYGRFEARFKTSGTREPGLQEAFWLWPDIRYQNLDEIAWPAAGEIDIAETYSLHPDHAIPFLHYTANDNGGPIPGVNTAWHCLAKRGEFNTYTLEWTAERIVILVNGKTCLVNTSGDPAFKKRYIIAFTQNMGVQGDNAYDGRAPLPATMTIDYLRVWQ